MLMNHIIGDYGEEKKIDNRLGQSITDGFIDQNIMSLGVDWVLCNAKGMMGGQNYKRKMDQRFLSLGVKLKKVRLPSFVLGQPLPLPKTLHQVYTP